jgi:hypothetical protein
MTEGLELMSDPQRTEARFEICVEYFARPDDPTLTDQDIWNVIDSATERSESPLAEFDIGAISVKRI